MEGFSLSAKKFSILQEITSAIIVTDNVNSVANLMLDLAINYTDAEKGSLMFLNDREELYILAARGIDIELIQTYRDKIGEGIAGTVAKNRQPVLVEDIEKDVIFKRKKRDRYKTRSFISCPIVSKNRLLGVLNINDKKDGLSFTEDEFALIKIITNLAAIALENSILMNQLRRNAAEIEEINRKLIEADVVKTEFLARLSHELRTPLNSTKGAVYHLAHSEKLSEAEQKEFYDIISNETDKLISTIETQMDFLRLEDETRIVKRTIINLQDLLNDVFNLKSVENVFARKNIQLKIDLKEGISSIIGDKIRIVHFFINLIEGFSEYLERGDSIGITAEENDFIEVRIGLSRRIPEAKVPYLFDSYDLFKAGKTSEKIKLYLAKKVAEVHKWRLTAANSDDGFLISLTIPKSTRQKTEALINTSAEIFVEFISEFLEVNICSIMLMDELTGELTIASSRGLDDDVVKHTRINLGESISGWVALEGKPLLIEDIERDPRFGRTNIPPYSTKSLLSLPIKIQDKVIGVLNLNNKKTAELFKTQDLYSAFAISERFSHFIEKLYTGEYRENEFRQFVTSFENLIRNEKKYRKRKNILPDLMIRMLDKLGATEEEKKTALYISKIYDLGLVLIDETVSKKGKLTPSEESALKAHPYTTLSLLGNFEFSEDVKKAILHHHERYDGKGYPDGLKGEEIPFLSRFLSIVDSFYAMITEKPYRKAFTRDEALQEIKKGSGSVYDPKLVGVFEEVMSLQPPDRFV